MPPKRKAAEAELQNRTGDATDGFYLDDRVYTLDDVRTLALGLLSTHVDFSAGKRRGSGRWIVSALNIPALACTDDTNTSHMAYVCALDVLRKDHGLPNPPGFPVDSVRLAMRKRLDLRSQQYNGRQRCTHCVAPLRRRRRPPKHGWMGCFSVGGKRCASCAANRRYHCFFPDPEVEVTREVNVRPAFEEDVFTKREHAATPEPAPEPALGPFVSPELDTFDYASPRRKKVEADVAAALARERANGTAKRQKTAAQETQPPMAAPAPSAPKASTSGTQQVQMTRMVAPQSSPRPGARTRSEAAGALATPQVEPQTGRHESPLHAQEAAMPLPELSSRFGPLSPDPVEAPPFDFWDLLRCGSPTPSPPHDLPLPASATMATAVPTLAPPPSSSDGHFDVDNAGTTVIASTSSTAYITPFSKSSTPMPPTPLLPEEPVAGKSTSAQAGPSSRPAPRTPNHSTSNQFSASGSHSSSLAQKSSPPAPQTPPVEPASASIPTPQSPVAQQAPAPVEGNTAVDARVSRDRGALPKTPILPPAQPASNVTPATPSLATFGLLSRLYTAYSLLYPALKTAIEFDDPDTTRRLYKLASSFTGAVEKAVAGGVAEVTKLPIYWDRVERDLDPTLAGNRWLKDRLLKDAAQLGELIRKIVVANGLSEILVDE